MVGGIGSGGADDGARAGLHAPFRPHAARVVTLVLAALVVLLTIVLIAALPTIAPDSGSGDAAGIAVLGLAVAWFCWRQASVCALVDESGITVRNLLLSRRLAWAQVVSVRFGNGRPWVQLDLADGDTLAVMGIQRADGPRAEAEARRLATLVALHSRTSRDD
jgi:hypothetical protein